LAQARSACQCLRGGPWRPSLCPSAMPVRKPAKAAKEGPGGGQGRSDDEILKKRQRLEAFEAADKYLTYLGTSLWVVGAAWFFCMEKAPTVASLHRGAGDALLGLVATGSFCGSLAKSSPRGAWSAWRKPWHVAWCPALALLAVVLGLASRTAAEGRALPFSALACGLLALGAAATSPAGPPPSSAPSSESSAVAFARLLAVVDGLLGLALAGSALAASGGEGSTWSLPLGPAAMGMTAVPLTMLSLGVLLCRTEAELMAAVPAIMLFCLGAAARAAALSGAAAALLPAAALAVHAGLYLPLPVKDPHSNPFNRYVSLSWKAFARWMSDPVQGWSEE